jgi:hypothetical protein
MEDSDEFIIVLSKRHKKQKVVNYIYTRYKNS